jgi:AmmeMemoRadiSam system protein B
MRGAARSEYTRPPAVAGSFYPADRAELERMLGRYLSQVEVPGGAAPKAVIAPHAGYVYSGPVAASAYARLAPARGRVSRVVLLGPSHRVALRGLAAPDATAFATPLGEIPLDVPALERVLGLPQVRVLHAAHEQEHSLEVHLPFLQVVLGTFSLVPLVAGDASAREVAEVLELLWGGEETLVVVSSDLSHYHDYATAKRLDAATTRAIEALEPEALDFDDACGRVPIRGLLEVAHARSLTPITLDVRSSGDTAGPRDQVVGYGSWAFS